MALIVIFSTLKPLQANAVFAMSYDAILNWGKPSPNPIHSNPDYILKISTEKYMATKVDKERTYLIKHVFDVNSLIWREDELFVPDSFEYLANWAKWHMVPMALLKK